MAKPSQAALMMQPGSVGVQPNIPGAQPRALEELAPDEAAEWDKFVQRMPPDWFPPETWVMLAHLCGHICQARFLRHCLQEVRAGILDPTDDEQLERVERLQRLYDREGRAMTALMVRLRLTSQQRLSDPNVADRARERLKDEHVEVAPWVTGEAFAADWPQ